MRERKIDLDFEFKWKDEFIDTPLESESISKVTEKKDYRKG